MLPAGTRGVVVEVGGTQAICWDSSYSAWELFALETASIFHQPGVGVGEYLRGQGVLEE